MYNRECTIQDVQSSAEFLEKHRKPEEMYLSNYDNSFQQSKSNKEPKGIRFRNELFFRLKHLNI